MDKNNRNQENDDDDNVYGMRKTTYLEKYGVKHFPYRGRRKYTPLINKSVDGGMFISNDVFGLTMRQFERMYKDCLHRRKTHKQYILNLRYPDKSSNEYLEYLQNCKDCHKEHAPWPENELKEKELFELLVRTVGTEIDMRTRQRLFIIQDMIFNAINYNTQISSGSLAEGLDLPGSDEDIMYVLNEAVVIRNVRNTKYLHHCKHSLQHTIFVMETDNDHYGFTRLRLIAAGDGFFNNITSECFESTAKGLYLSVNGFVNNMKKKFPHLHLISHGPCLTDKYQDDDLAFCLRSKYLPYKASPWAIRCRRQWPSNVVIDKIKQFGCLLVPIGPKNVSDSNILWRLSFSMAEKQLVHSFNFTQFLCYALLKITLKRIVNTNNDVKELLCSYFMKTALFWVSEEVDIETFQIPKLFFCFFLCLNKLISWVKNCYCPNYFIPEHNMFLEKITPDNNKMLLRVLNTIQSDGIDRLTRNLFPPYNGNALLISTKSESSFITLDFLFYRISGYWVATHISQCYKAMTLIASLIKSESSSFIIDVCKHEYAIFSQLAVQLLPSPTIINKMYKRYHTHLQDCTKTDAVTGWLLYASFYYVTEQYDVTLKLTDYVLSKCSPDLVHKEYIYQEERINSYKKNVHSTMTAIERMKIAAVDMIYYLQQSSLIPGELQLEVENRDIYIPPITMSHCLRFLCYHHQGNILNRQHALRDLYSTVKEDWAKGLKKISNSLTILGVCVELSGDKNTAYECFQNALQCDFIICPSAKIRISKLFDV
ncbi:unnamed protein product [Mytilus coruscus]|uniref:Uncharacterized protein n=1 Tax=Mytilus coruscus TaxID=42192 RepID=A0A6J8CNB5_MYTCO|nr:unnamed protein product [Mytilus coruscus]